MAKELNSKQKRTLEAIYKNPTPANIGWKDIESLFIACGAIVREGNGSRVRIFLNGVKAVFHEPHPEREASQGTVKSVRDFLSKAGVFPDLDKL
jgi:hypothetical protein